MSAELCSQVFDRPSAEGSELIECLRKIGKGLITSSTSLSNRFLKQRG
jgi:hypothetical protein